MLIPSLLSSNGRGRRSPLPSFSDPRLEEKQYLSGRSPHSQTLMYPIFVKVPFVDHRVRIFLPIPAPLQQHLVSRLGRRRGLTVSWVIVLFFLWVIYAFARRFGSYHRTWPPPFTGDLPTLIFKRADLAAVWEWEIASGHYQSSRPSKLWLSYLKISLISYQFHYK